LTPQGIVPSHTHEPIVENTIVSNVSFVSYKNVILPQPPPLALTNNPVHISDVIDEPVQEEAVDIDTVDMELETEIENYMLHVRVEENNTMMMEHAHTTKDKVVQRYPLQDIRNKQEFGEIDRDMIDLDMDPILLGSTVVNEVCSQPPPIQVLPRPGPTKPTAITLELLSIDTNQEKRFSFIDDVEEKLERAASPVVNLDDNFSLHRMRKKR